MDGIIQVQHLSKIYTMEQGKKVHALEDINLDIYPNDFICIVGPSGCGKSTLLKILAGLEAPSSGSVCFQGAPIIKPSRDIGLVFQEYSLLPWRTVIDNISLGLEFNKQPKQERLAVAEQFLQLVGLQDFAGAYPYELSGGMQQRVAIARALANNPQVLLMDEPFGQLDAQTRYAMEEEIQRIWREDRKTVIFVTNNIEEAVYLGDRIVLLSKRPAKIKAIYDIDLPRPRDMVSQKFLELRTKISNNMDLDL